MFEIDFRQNKACEENEANYCVAHKCAWALPD
jgi:hypothetical protein